MNLILLICKVFDNENDHDYDDGEGTRSSEPRVTGCIGRLKLTCSITLILFLCERRFENCWLSSRSMDTSTEEVKAVIEI